MPNSTQNFTCPISNLLSFSPSQLLRNSIIVIFLKIELFKLSLSFHPASCSISSTPYILSFNPKYFSHICLLFSQTLPLTICSLKNSQGKLIDVKIKVKFLKFLKYCFSGKFFRSSSWEQDFNLLPSPVFSILLSPTLVVCYAEMTCLNVYSFGLTPVLIVFGLQEFCFILGLE